MVNLFDLAVTTIFAREFMEGAIIIGEFRTAIQRTELPTDGPSEAVMLRNVYLSAAAAAALAVAVIVIVAIPLAVMSNDFDDRTATIIEGVSKVVAAICILQLSLKMPKWFGIYKKKNAQGKVDAAFDCSLNNIRFNVAWNIWREVAECGAFLLPFFLQGDNVAAIPLSALIGMVVGLVCGFGVYAANQSLQNKIYLAVFTTLLLVFLSTGLFVGGCHEFEEVYGETKDVWKINSKGLSHKRLPMAILKPFGYSSSRTVLQITTFWLWLTLAACLHGFMIHRTIKVTRELAEAQEATKTGEKGSIDKETSEPSGDEEMQA